MEDLRREGTGHGAAWIAAFGVVLAALIAAVVALVNSRSETSAALAQNERLIAALKPERRLSTWK